MWNIEHRMSNDEGDGGAKGREGDGARWGRGDAVTEPRMSNDEGKGGEAGRNGTKNILRPRRIRLRRKYPTLNVRG
jgi:hypothetical protein